MLARTLMTGLDPKSDDATNFALFNEALHADVKPVGVLEHLHLERAASAYYRLHRGAHFEAELVKHRDSFGWDGMDRLNRYVAAANRELSSALHELERLQRQRAGQNLPAPVLVDINVNAVPLESAATPEEGTPALSVREPAALESPAALPSELLDVGVADSAAGLSSESSGLGETRPTPMDSLGVAAESEYETKPENPGRTVSSAFSSTLVTALAPVVGVES